MPVCPGCGASYEDTYKFCPHCGRSKPAPQQINVVLEAQRPRNACPICGNIDQVQKVMAIVNQNTVQISGTSQSTSTYVDAKGYTRREISDNPFSGVQQSNLASRLSPPAKPEAKGACLRYILYIPALFIGIASVGGLATTRPSDQSANLLPLAWVGLLVSILLITWISLSIKKVNRKGKEKHALEMERWNRAMARWEQLYYCHRDDAIYLPGQSKTIPAQNLTDYLYSE